MSETCEAHDNAVTEIYEAYKDNIDELRWDLVFRNVEYFRDEKEHEERGYEQGQVKGECDVFLIDDDAGVVKYIEVKTNSNDVEKANNQIERAKSHWEGKGMDLIGEIVLVNGSTG